MFKIGEFSKLVRVSARMLRYYDKCGLLHPAQVDRFTGYRLYSASQIPLLSRIVLLRDMGFGVEEIEEILPRFDDSMFMKRTLQEKGNEIRASIEAEQSKLEKIMSMSISFEKERTGMIYEVELKALKEENILALREKISSYDQEGTLWEKLGRFMTEHGVTCGAGGYSIYHDDEYKEQDVDVEIAVPVTELKESNGPAYYRKLAAIPQAATIRFSGPYEGYSAAIEKLASWVEENGYQFDGVVRGLAVASPADVKSEEDFLTELQVPVKKA